MAIKTESKEAVKDSANAIEVIGEYVALKKEGSVHMGLCPFQDEATPSFTVYKTNYHCFGCGAHGDVIDFLQKHTGVRFDEAVKMLGEKYGVKVEETENKGPNHSPLLKALEEVGRFYQYWLLEEEEGKEALRYLSERGFDLDDIRLFGLGLVPTSDDFWKFYNQKCPGVKTQEIGVSVKGFEGRIAFPVRDAMGRTVGFTCRVWGDLEGTKYRNSCETALFKKNLVLYGLDLARKRIARDGQAILVEGTTDVMRLAKAGLALGIASLGTAFNIEHVRSLKKYGTEKVYIAFDGDEAGQKAIVKAGAILQGEGIEPLVVGFGEKDDADSFIKREGVSAFQEKLQNASGFVPFLARYMLKKHGSTPNGKSKAYQECLAIIEKWPDAIVSAESKKILANELGLDLKRAGAVFMGDGKQVKGGLRNALEAERRALCTILLFWSNTVLLHSLKEEDFINPDCEKIFSLLKANKEVPFDKLPFLFDEGLRPAISDLRNYATSESVLDAKKVIVDLRRGVIMSKLKGLKEEFKRGLSLGNETSTIVEEIKFLEKSLRDLG